MSTELVVMDLSFSLIEDSLGFCVAAQHQPKAYFS